MISNPEHVEPNGVLKQGALDVQVTTSFGVNTLGNKESRYFTSHFENNEDVD